MAVSISPRLSTAANNALFIGMASLLATGLFMLSNKSSDAYQVAAPIVVTAPDCSKAKGIAKVVCMADNFKAMLNPEQLAALQLQYSKTDAKKWSNFPTTFRNATRVGLKLGTLTTEQLQAAKALIKEISGTETNEGFDELEQLLNADDNLALKNSSDYGAGMYYLAFLGTPSASGMFEIQYGGHHVAFANTYKDGILVGATPSFRGVEPFGKFEQNGRTNQPLEQEQGALSAMLAGLTTDQQTTAKLTDTYRDILTGPNRDTQFPATPSGIKVSNLSAAQKKLVIAAINTYVDDIDDKDAAIMLKKYTNELDDTYISFSGTTGLLTRNDYVRIDGPSVWIEYSCQNGIILPGNHPHSVWRDKTSDYGGK